MKIPLLDLELARRIELSEGEAAVACAKMMMAQQAGSGAAVASIGGGYAVYCGQNSPVTQAIGLGLNGPVPAEEFDQLEAFYFSRKEPVRVETCPLADASLIEHYKQRGYWVSEFTNVMIRPLRGKEKIAGTDGVEVRRAGREELELWTLTVAQGFAENQPVTQELLEVMKMFALAKNSELYLARIDGRVAGGGTLAIREKTAGLFGASTLPDFRGRGVQTALVRARLQRAAETGCEMAVSLARPGSISQRNITRQGFAVLYTRVKFERGWEKRADSR